MRERETFFSSWGPNGEQVTGPMTRFGGQILPADKELDAEWFAWMIEELVAERDCILIFERSDDNQWYVQFAVSPDGKLAGESVSNSFLSAEDRLSPAEEGHLLSLGWFPPNSAWPISNDSDPSGRPVSPNFYRSWDAPVASDEVSLLALRTLRDVHGGSVIEELSFMFFRRAPDGVEAVPIKTIAPEEDPPGKRLLFLGHPPDPTDDAAWDRFADDMFDALEKGLHSGPSDERNPDE